MKQKMLPLVFMLLCVLCSVPGCKKEKAADAAQLSLEKTSYYQLEIAQLQTGSLQLNDSVYPATIGTTLVEVTRESGQLVFIMPLLSPGNHTLSITLNDQDYTAEFTIAATPVTSAPAVVNQVMQDITETCAMLTAFADTLPADEKAQWTSDVQTMQQWKDSLQQQFNSLTTEQQQQCADFLAANQWWLDEVHDAVTVLHTNTRSFKTNDDVEDYEAKVESAMADFVAAKIKVVRHIPKIAKLTLIGAGLGSIFPVVGTAVGASIGAAIAIIKFSDDFIDLKSSLEDLMSTSFVPYQNLFTSGKTMAFISFISNLPKEFRIKMEYRSPYSADNTSSVPLVAELVNGLKEIRAAWNTIASKLPAGLYAPRVVAEKSYFRTGLREVHSKYVTIDDFDPGDYTIQQLTKQNGFFIVNLINNTGQTLYPTFRVTYNNPRLGAIVAYEGASINPYGPNTCAPDVTDIDGNVYPVVRIGSLCWMKENLRTSRFRNGELIPQFQVDSFYKKSQAQISGYGLYNDNPAYNYPYGKLYNGYAMDDPRGVCPVGWHVPSVYEFRALVDSLGGTSVAGGKLKTTDQWAAGSTADNESGFSAYPTGYIAFDSSYAMGQVTEFWTTTWPNFPSGDETFTAKLSNTNNGVSIPSFSGNAGNDWTVYGLPIRCVKD
jgi:uncharacterized protein (TIGR02145 family)